MFWPSTSSLLSYSYSFLCTTNRFTLCRFTSTIFALSSGPTPAAIAIVRISGDKSEFALRQLTRKRKPFLPLQLFYTPIFDQNNRLLDNAMACFMKGPKTFTGEDSAELYLHGSRAVVQAVCATLAQFPGFEAARAGEFTRRAFYNGKLDAAQVEALGDLLHAETDVQLRLCHAQARIGEYLRPTRERLVKLMARMEARIDFAEDIGDLEQSLDKEFSHDIDVISNELRRLLRSANRGQLIRTGVNLALVGRPNVGKSSLMNRLAERELSIVSNISGTTRDCLESRLHLNGQLINLVDTAGICIESNDQLEREGIRRTLDRATQANLILLILEPAHIQNRRRELDWLLAQFNFKPEVQQLIICVNKADLIPDKLKRKQLEEELNSIGPYPLVWTSCLHENGVDPLLNAITVYLEHRNDGTEYSEVCLSRERHVQCLQKALEHIETTRQALSQWDDPAMAAFSLKQCADAVGEIAGTIVTEQVLDSIFSQFCIGK